MTKKDILHKIGDSENDFFCGRKSLDEHKKLVSDSKKLIKNDKDFDEAISYYEDTIRNIEKGVDEFGQSYKEGIEFSKKLENPKFKVGEIVESVSNGKKYLISDICVCENVVGDYGRFRWSKCYVFKNENGGYLDNASGHYVEDCLTADNGWYKKVENKTNMSISAKGFKFPNSNLYFHGTKHNVNGNKVLQFSFSGGRKFSIYPSAFGYYNTIYFSKGDDFNEFAKDHFGSVENFEKQIVSYIVNRGTEMQKNELYYDENKINFACGKGNFSAKDGEGKFAWYKYSKKYQTNDNYTDYGLVCLERQKSHRGTYYVGIEVSIPNDPKKEDFTYQPHFEVERPSDLAHNGVKVQPDKRMLKIEKWLSKNQFSILDDTKDVLRAGGKLAGNIVKNTLYNGGILMF